MKKRGTRLLALLLALVMTVGLLPGLALPAYAAEDTQSANTGAVHGKDVKEEVVWVYAVVDGDRENAKRIYSGKAPHGANVIEWLEENVRIEDRQGYTVDKWYMLDWYGHKFDEKRTVNGWTNVYVTYNKIPMVNVVVKSVLDGDKSTAETIWTGKAPKGAKLVEWLTANVEVDVAEGFTWDNTWMNWDWFGHKHNDKATVNGWTNVYVNFTKCEEPAVITEFFVSPDGDDSNSGTSAEDAFATIEAARAAVDAINEDMQSDITVNIAPGDYYLDEAIEFGVSDSGMNGYEVIYRCTGDVGEARIHGGKKVEGEWVPADDADVALGLRPEMTEKVYKIDLDENKFQFNTLYVNGSRAINARTSNFEYDPQFPASRGPWLYAAGGGVNRLNYKAGDLDEASLNGMRLAQERGEEEIAQVTTWCGTGWGVVFNWFTDTVPLASLDEVSRQLNFRQVEGHPEMYRSKYGVAGGSRYIVHGNIGFLDAEGEYFYHKPTGTLYYYPCADESMDSIEVVAPTTIEALKFQGSKKAAAKDVPDPEKQVHNITFYGVTVMDTDFPEYYSSSWNSYDNPGNGPQIGYFPEEALRDGITNPSYCEVTERPELRTGAIVLRDANHITVDSCRITNIGLHGLFMDGDNTYHTVKNCEFTDIGHSGIITDGGYPGIGKYNDHHTLENLLVHDVGNLAGNAYGIAIMASNNNKVSHVEIYNSPRRGFYLLGTWANRHKAHNANCPEGCIFDTSRQFYDSNTYENDIEYLYLHDCEQEGSDDGAFFTSTLYGSWGDNSGVKPNRLNQVVIGDIAAFPGISSDWNPSNMNLDMGAKGLELRNLKSINPQQLNIRGGHDVALMENVNYFHYTNADGFAGNGGCNMWRTFDDSKMDYANIGVIEGFPFGETTAEKYQNKPDSAYEDLYFRDDFDNGLTEWWSMSGKCETSPVFFSDGNKMHGSSFRADSNWNADPLGNQNGTNIQRPFGKELNKIVEIDFYDRFLHGIDGGIWAGARQDIHMNAFARVDDGEVNCGIGVNSTKDFNYYMYEIGDTQYSTKVPRKAGWHTLKWDYSQEGMASLYIDGTLIAEVEAESFNTIRMGDYGKRGAAYFDNVVVYGGEDAGELEPLPPKPEEPEEPEQIFALPGRVEAEDCAALPAGTQVADIPSGGRAVGYLSVGNVFAYRVKTETDIDMNFVVSAASNKDASEIEVYVDDEATARFHMNFAYTGGWNSYEEHNGPKLALTAGEHTIRIKVLNNNFNFDAFMLKEVEEVEPTIRPVAGQKFEAESFDKKNGMSDDGSTLGNVNNGTWACYENLDFGEVESVYDVFVNVGIHPDYAKGHFTFRLDAPDGPQVGQINFTSTGDFVIFEEQMLTLDPVKGVHDLYLVAGGQNFGICNFDYFRFSEAAVEEQP